jgi:hypothetical protein
MFTARSPPESVTFAALLLMPGSAPACWISSDPPLMSIVPWLPLNPAAWAPQPAALLLVELVDDRRK